jgi:hypothetical protein
LHPIGAIEEDVQVAVRGRFDTRDAVHGAERPGQFLGDGAGGLPKTAGEGKGHGRRDVAKRAAGRHFESHFADRGIVGGQSIQAADRVGQAGAYELMDGQNHKLFRDTIFGRFLIQFNPASGARVIA